jgi:transposase
MKMPYSKNPYLPKVRAKAVDMYRQGHSMRTVARHFGVSVGTISKWNKRTPPGGAYLLETGSSRPKSHPNATPRNIIKRICEIRRETNGRCAEVIHKILENEGIKISSSRYCTSYEKK